MDSPRRGDICAVFVHAGAGFHALQNEKMHLETCEYASKMAMALLKSGATAVDAVEMAITLLEDAEITNAGYGSNLTMAGAVECDATIIDHLGRSGAAGAVPNVKNPISLARVIYSLSNRPLSLQRVPPNFLVGQGATDFAYEQGLVTLPPDGLISPAAQERWNRWQKDLEVAEAKQRQQQPARFASERFAAYHRRPAALHPAHFLSTPPDHSFHGMPSPANNILATIELTPSSARTGDGEYIHEAVSHPWQHSNVCDNAAADHPVRVPGGASVETPVCLTSEGTSAMDVETALLTNPELNGQSEDHISDTVGAIAVDSYGNIAAGSSSGGIGMKHSGRVGPAALVGIGTFVIPADPTDPEQTSVATVTSGTGEHIATSLAAHTCASRVYYSHRKCDGGTFEEVNEDAAISAMISNDFMEHPGVKGSPCVGAIGVMTVKKTTDGIFLFFAHNTDSFALASMSSEDRKPVSVMSRSNGYGSVAQGGRFYRPRSSRHRATTVATQ